MASWVHSLQSGRKFAGGNLPWGIADTDNPKATPMTTFRRLAVMFLLAALLTGASACHKNLCRDNDSRFRDRDCRD